MKFFILLTLISLHSNAQTIPPLYPPVHRCDAGIGSGGVASPVSPNVGLSTETPAQKFAKVVNRSLSCCVNAKSLNYSIGVNLNSTTADDFEKLDCKERNYQGLTFDEIWSQANDGTSSGVPNAALLRNSAGEIVTGFFTSDLQRCNQYSEFTRDVIQPGFVPAAMTTTQQAGGAFQAEGPAIVKPTVTAWNEIASTINKHAPNCGQNLSECRRCNILIRAVVIPTCPVAATKTVTGSAPLLRHCGVADKIQIRIQARQIYRIGGQPTFKTFDTELDSRDVSSISVSDLFSN